MLPETGKQVKQAQRKYCLFREEQRARLKEFDGSIDDEHFWKTSSENAPETRIEIAKRSKRNKKNEEEEVKETKSVHLFNKEGRPLNVNQAKLQFKFCDNPKELLLDIAVYK